jgi:hypothetical protein
MPSRCDSNLETVVLPQPLFPETAILSSFDIAQLLPDFLQAVLQGDYRLVVIVKTIHLHFHYKLQQLL